MAKHPYGANSETLLVLAWLSTLDLPALAHKDRAARPWKYPSYRPSWDKDQQPAFPEELVHEQIDGALECFKADPIYGPLFEALVRYRLTYLDDQRVAWAIELRELADPSSGLYFSDNPFYAKHHQPPQVADETTALLQLADSHIPLTDRLQRLSTTCNGDVCCGACELQAFFNWYLALSQRPLRMSFFLAELVRISLARIDWHRIAAHLLQVPAPAHEACHCAALAQEVHVGATAEYLGELLKATGDEIMVLGQQLPDPERTQSLLLADLCRETTRAMRLFLMRDGHN